MNNLEPAFLEVAEKEIVRILPWFYKTPMLLSRERFGELRRLQKLLYRAILFFVENYEKHEGLLPLNPKARAIVDIASKRPYRVGAYRPDYVISQDHEIRICEIGARFPLDGFFNAGISELIANKLTSEQGLDQPPLRYRKFFAHLIGYFGRFEGVCAMKSPADRPMDLRLYSQIFEKSGLPFTFLRPDEIEAHLEILSRAAVIDEINQMDLESLDPWIIEKIAAANSLNDLRTKFLIHDKRFLSVLTNTAFLSKFLNDDDMEFLGQHVIPTYTRAQNPDLWEEARRSKDRWLLKPYLLGKSAGLLAGWVTDEERWQAAFRSTDIEKMILQPFIRQKQFVASLEGRMYMDYVVGAFLCFDDEFLGPGRFRASSFPITNLGDDRKVAPFVIDQTGELKSPFIL